ncbi:hypothetical protein J4434_04265 [Candidatus Woesearchaeota archaeon]|nr:hypothetical protein [Candidatus Woesearchaeota archaeon]
MIYTPAFNNDKTQCLSKMKNIDKSKKGSVDASIIPLLKLINSKKDYYTTSSCSGRIIVMSIPPDGKKLNTKWLFVSHDTIKFEEFKFNFPLQKELSKKSSIGESTYLRFEPFILHVAARDLDSALKLLKIAQAIGFKRCGIIAANHRIILELMGVDRIDAPIAKDKKLIVSEDYLRFIIEEANNKLNRNKERIDLFYEKIDSAL